MPGRRPHPRRGLRRKKFITPAPSTAKPMRMTLANLSTNAATSANRPSFLAATPPTSAIRPYSAMRSVEALKSS